LIESARPASDRPRVRTLRDPEALQALAHPTRVEILEALRDPASAAAVARQIGQPRQRVNYHLKALEDAGLVEPVGERQSGNFVERLYRSVARAFVVAPEVAWRSGRRLEALRSQHALETLVAFGERLQADAVELLDRAAFDDEEIASAAVSAEACFDTPEDRAAFMREYLLATRALLERYGSREGAPYRVVLAVHPQTEGSQQ
jgi:DNA-binding transcriptional ArsR family regulator